MLSWCQLPYNICQAGVIDLIVVVFVNSCTSVIIDTRIFSNNSSIDVQGDFDINVYIVSIQVIVAYIPKDTSEVCDSIVVFVAFHYIVKHSTYIKDITYI